MARTNSNLAQFMQLLTKAIDSDLIPALTVQSAPGETMRKFVPTSIEISNMLSI